MELLTEQPTTTQLSDSILRTLRYSAHDILLEKVNYLTLQYRAELHKRTGSHNEKPQYFYDDWKRGLSPFREVHQYQRLLNKNTIKGLNVGNRLFPGCFDHTRNWYVKSRVIATTNEVYCTNWSDLKGLPKLIDFCESAGLIIRLSDVSEWNPRCKSIQIFRYP